MDHPLVHDALVDLLDRRATPEQFRRPATQIGVLWADEGMKGCAERAVTVEAPLHPAPGLRTASDIVVVPVLRPGLGMLDAVLQVVPSARVAHIGLQHDETTAVASQYYAKLPV